MRPKLEIPWSQNQSKNHDGFTQTYANELSVYCQKSLRDIMTVCKNIKYTAWDAWSVTDWGGGLMKAETQKKYGNIQKE